MGDSNRTLYAEQLQNDFGADQEVAAVLGCCLGWYAVVFSSVFISYVWIIYMTFICMTLL